MQTEESSKTNGQSPTITDVQRLVAKIRTADLGTVRELCRTLVDLDVPEMGQLMEPLLDDENPDLSLAAYDWLANTADPQATKILLNRLTDTGRSDNERWLAAESLGKRSDRTVLDPL